MVIRSAVKSRSAVGAWKPGAAETSETTETFTVVGVVRERRRTSLDREPQSQIYVPYGARFRAAMVLHVGIGAEVGEAAMLTTDATRASWSRRDAAHSDGPHDDRAARGQRAAVERFERRP